MNDFVLSPGDRTAPEVETASRDPQLARLATRLSSVLAAEQLRIDEEMHETRHFLASIFDNIPNVIFVKDARTLRFVRVNAAAERLLGYREYEMQSKTDHDLFPKAQADYFEATDRAALASGEQVLVPAEAITCKNGSTRLLQTKKFTIRDQDGSPLYLLGMAEDITERALAEQRLRDSERQYRQLIEQASDGIFISDADGNFLIVNTRGCELLGYRREEMIGMNGKVTYVDSELDLHTARMRAVTEGQELRYERLVKRKDGSTFPAEISLKRLEGGLVQVIFHDITKRREQEQRIARLSRIQAVQSGINSAIVRIRDRQELLNEACRIATTIASFPIAWIGLVNPATGALEPVASAGLDKSFFLDLARSQGRSAFAPAGVGTRSIAQGRTIVDNNILSEPDIDGVRRMAVACGCRSAIGLPLTMDGAVVGTMMFYGAEQDFFDDAEVTLLEELASDVSFALTFIAQQEKVEFLAYYDPVTGLPNRSLFFDKLSRQIAAAAQSGNGVALILVDLNRFRLINDTLGRKAGDALLDAVARRLADAARPDEAIARVGSNRFALAIPGHWTDAAAVSGIEARCHACFERTFLIEGEELRVSASAGVAVHPMHAADAESLYANAEAALRNAQADNLPVQYYGPEMNARVAESLHLENRLKRALANDELVLWYQPKVDIATGRLQGFEALMRWNDPETGLVPPGKFIPLMEQTGLILDAGRWALARVAEDCRHWAKPGGAPLRIAVNVSPLQLRQRDFVATVIDAASRTEEAGCALDLEITESAIMHNVEAIVPKLQTIRGLGVEISIDDFGTGYSSLAYVARLPIHALKIDRSFVVGMTQSEDSLAIVRSVISLAHSLRLSVIAEGVETPEQEALLRTLACDEMQGYRISPPLPPEQIRGFILARG